MRSVCQSVKDEESVYLSIGENGAKCSMYYKFPDDGTFRFGIELLFIARNKKNS